MLSNILSVTRIKIWSFFLPWQPRLIEKSDFDTHFLMLPGNWICILQCILKLFQCRICQKMFILRNYVYFNLLSARIIILRQFWNKNISRILRTIKRVANMSMTIHVYKSVRRKQFVMNAAPPKYKFGQVPFFLHAGNTTCTADNHPKYTGGDGVHVQVLPKSFRWEIQ